MKKSKIYIAALALLGCTSLLGIGSSEEKVSLSEAEWHELEELLQDNTLPEVKPLESGNPSEQVQLQAPLTQEIAVEVSLQPTIIPEASGSMNLAQDPYGWHEENPLRRQTAEIRYPEQAAQEYEQAPSQAKVTESAGDVLALDSKAPKAKNSEQVDWQMVSLYAQEKSNQKDKILAGSEPELAENGSASLAPSMSPSSTSYGWKSEDPLYKSGTGTPIYAAREYRD